MTTYRSLNSVFINTTQNTVRKFNEIENVFNTLYSVMIEGKLRLPLLNAAFTNLVDGVDLINNNIQTQLSVTKNGMKVGYNPIKIYSSTTETERKTSLAYIDDEYNQELWQLSKIYELLNHNINHHKLLSHLFVDDLRDYYYNNLLRFSSLETTFNYIFKQNEYLDGDATLDNDTIISIPYLVGYNILYRLYDISFDYITRLTLYIQDNEILTDSDITDGFYTYINDYNAELSDSIAKFMYNNVYYFGNDVVNDVDASIETVIGQLLQDLPTMFSESKLEYDIIDVTYSIIQDVKHFISQMSATKWMHCSNNVSFNGGFYENMDQLFNNDDGMLDYFSMVEDKVESDIIDYLQSNQSELNELQLISKQYSENPLYFINTYMITYNRLALNMMQYRGFFTSSNVNTWLSRFQLTAGSSTFIINFMNDHPLEFSNDNNTALKLALLLKMRRIIYLFLESDEFELWLIKKFIPTVDKTVNQNYHTIINYTDQIDKLKSFFKLLFTKHLLETDTSTNKHKFLGDYFDTLQYEIIRSITDSETLLTTENVNNLVTNELSYYNRYYNFFNSFFKSATLVRFANAVLGSYSL